MNDLTIRSRIKQLFQLVLISVYKSISSDKHLWIYIITIFTLPLKNSERSILQSDEMLVNPSQRDLILKENYLICLDRENRFEKYKIANDVWNLNQIWHFIINLCCLLHINHELIKIHCSEFVNFVLEKSNLFDFWMKFKIVVVKQLFFLDK